MSAGCRNLAGSVPSPVSDSLVRTGGHGPVSAPAEQAYQQGCRPAGGHIDRQMSLALLTRLAFLPRPSHLRPISPAMGALVDPPRNGLTTEAGACLTTPTGRAEVGTIGVQLAFASVAGGRRHLGQTSVTRRSCPRARHPGMRDGVVVTQQPVIRPCGAGACLKRADSDCGHFAPRRAPLSTARARQVFRVA